MKKFFLATIGLIGLLLGSCQQDDHLGGATQSSKGLKLVLSVSDIGSGETRATVDAVNGEETVKSLYLFFFEPSSDRSGTYQGYLKLEGTLTMNTDIELSGMSANQDLDISAAYRILAVANVGSYLGGVSESDWVTSLERGITEESVVFNEMLAYISGGEQIESENIIMTGQADKPADPLATIPLTLTRGLVRFDVVNSARTDYNLLSVSIYNAFPQTSMFGGGIMPYETMGRIRKLYGIDNNINNTYPDIFGGLYSFPNQVISPEGADQKTTCLIVCLKKADGSEAQSYHRINIAAQDAMQNLKRNNVYRLTILSVSGQGASSELEAYAGGVNNINYKINYWDLDDDGLIQQNGSVILGIPTKRIRFGAEADERTYEVFAFGGAAGEQIVVSTSDLATGLDVRQSGNTITVKAEALTAASQERTGTIRITYGGLTASIGILQSGEVSKFLRITTPSGQGISPFPYSPGATASVEVTASEEWTATIYNFGSQDFVFDNGLTTMSSTDLSTVVNLETTRENNTGSPIQSFVLFALNSDSDNYNSALVLTQRARGRIELSPNINRVQWNGVGNLMTTGGLNQTQFKFTVNPSVDLYGKFLPWTAALGKGTSSDFKIVGQNYDEDVANDNYVIVEVKGTNEGTPKTDVLRISLRDEPSTFVDVNLEQESFELRITPNTFTPITNKGGSTGAISISSNKTTLTWSAEVVGMKTEKGTISPTHRAAILDAATNGSLVEGKEYSLSQEFKVNFPKLLYGDHKKGEVTASVKITLWSEEGGVKKVANIDTLTVKQKELVPSKLTIHNYRGLDRGYTQNWGTLYTTTDYYNQAWRSFITSLFTNYGDDIAYPKPQSSPLTRVYTTAEGVVLPTDQIKTSNNPISNTVNYVHASQANGISKANGSYGDQQGRIETWRQEDNGILVVTQSSPAHTGNTAVLFWPVRNVGWKGAGYLDATATTLRRNTGKKITKFIYEDGPFGPVGDDGSLTFKNNDSGQAMDVRGTNGVAIMGPDNKASLVIDPASRILFFGEGEFFSTSTGLDGVSIELKNSKSILLANIAAYAILTAQYGSNFSDLLID